jgi:hypothetical protein
MHDIHPGHSLSSDSDISERNSYTTPDGGLLDGSSGESHPGA